MGFQMIKVLIFSLSLTACGANTKAVEHAEIQCLEADAASLKAKLKSGIDSATGEAIALTDAEITCALQALSAKATAGN